MFFYVIVGIVFNFSKKFLFLFEEWVEMIKKVIIDLVNVEVVGFMGLLVDFVD